MIVAGMATMPDRLPYLREVVETIRPQVDVLRIYLNNFEKIPDFITTDEALLSGDAKGDLGDTGKFYWIGDEEGHNYTHYVTVDDDLKYPPDYIATLKSEFDTRDGQAVIGVHGSEFANPLEDFVLSRQNR